jgi:hypothetical protein
VPISGYIKRPAAYGYPGNASNCQSTHSFEYEEQEADIFTKPVRDDLFPRLRFMIMGCSEAVGDTSRLTSINGKLPWFTSSKRKVAVVHWSQFGLATGGECTQLCERFYMTVCVNFIACDNIYIII